MKLEFVAHSETGPVRRNNEDSAYASDRLMVIADGMGGAAAGDLASSVVVDEIRKIDEESHGVTGTAMTDKLADAADRANSRIAKLSADDSELEGMGSTMCGLMFDGEKFALANIGDSRVYRFRNNELTQLTHDHSWVQSLVDEGQITEDEAATHPYRSLVLKVVNGQAENEADLDMLDASLDDLYLICSDGLCGMTTDESIAKVLAYDEPLSEIVDKLVDLAYRGGGADNISIILSKVVTDAPYQPTEILGAAVSTLIPDDDDQEALTQTSIRHIPAISKEETKKQDSETGRYSPTVAPRRKYITIVMSIVIALVIISLGIFITYSWVQNQYFVGANNNHVTIFKGIPDKPFGISLSHIQEEAATLVSDLPPYYQDQVNQGIPSRNLADAQATVNELQNFATQCVDNRTQPQIENPPDPRAQDPELGNPPATQPTVTISPQDESLGGC